MTEQKICELFKNYSLYLFEGQSAYGARNPIIDLISKEYKREIRKQSNFNIFFEIPNINFDWLQNKVDYIPLPDDCLLILNIPWVRLQIDHR